MSSFVLNKQHLREVLIFFFNWKKSAAEAHRSLVEVYGESAPSDKSCREWFRRFKNGNFSVEDKERPGQPKKFEDAELEELLDQDPCQTQQELAGSLGVTQQAISVRLKIMGMVQKQGNWVPYELKPQTLKSDFSSVDCCSNDSKGKVFCIELLPETKSGYTTITPRRENIMLGLVNLCHRRQHQRQSRIFMV